MAIPANRLYSSRLFTLDPLVLFCVKNSQLAVVFLAIVSTENVQFLVVVSCRVVLNLRGALGRLNLCLLLILSGKILYRRIQGLS